MRFFTSAAALLTVASSTLSKAAPLAPALNTSTEYHLRTELVANQPHKERFNDLWLVATHTGAGLNDAVLYENKTDAIVGFTNATNITNPSGGFYQYQEFVLSDYPYGMELAYENSYVAWEPVRINAGQRQGAFFLNETGLQYATNTGATGYEAFAGWLVCQWWHGKPQLFAKINYYNYEIPSSCADVYLMPEYI